jgi:hypothetical protein
LQDYAAKGELAGGTAAAIFNDSPSVYHGIEDWELYEEGLVLYLQAMQKEGDIRAQLKTALLHFEWVNIAGRWMELIDS